MLIVEDDVPTEIVLSKIFRRQGWDVVSARTVESALRCLAPPVPDCMILDLMLPDGSGEEVLRKIRLENLPVKVAVCTGINDSERLEKLQMLKPEAIMRKPIEVAVLLRICSPQFEHETGQ